jgi:hypothetical protein
VNTLIPRRPSIAAVRSVGRRVGQPGAVRVRSRLPGADRVMVEQRVLTRAGHFGRAQAGGAQVGPNLGPGPTNDG